MRALFCVCFLFVEKRPMSDTVTPIVAEAARAQAQPLQLCENLRANLLRRLKEKTVPGKPQTKPQPVHAVNDATTKRAKSVGNNARKRAKKA